MFTRLRLNSLPKIFLALKSVCVQFSNKHVGRTHYEVLKLQSNCTEKEIKQSFVRLSKECHPDVSKHKNSHNQFVRLVDAYSTLSKPALRSQYDLTINARRPNAHKVRPGPGANENYYYRTWRDDPYMQNRSNFTYRANANRSESKPYGASAGTKISNLAIAGVCIMAAMISVGFQFMIIRMLVELGNFQEWLGQNETSSAIEQNHAIIKKKSIENGLIVADLREKARLMSNEESAKLILNLNQEPPGMFKIETPGCD